MRAIGFERFRVSHWIKFRGLDATEERFSSSHKSYVNNLFHAGLFLSFEPFCSCNHSPALIISLLLGYPFLYRRDVTCKHVSDPLSSQLPNSYAFSGVLSKLAKFSPHFLSLICVVYVRRGTYVLLSLNSTGTRYRD